MSKRPRRTTRDAIFAVVQNIEHEGQPPVKTASPLNWIDEENMILWWPPHDINVTMHKHELPDKKIWRQFKVISVGFKGPEDIVRSIVEYESGSELENSNADTIVEPENEIELSHQLDSSDNARSMPLPPLPTDFERAKDMIRHKKIKPQVPSVVNSSSYPLLKTPSPVSKAQRPGHVALTPSRSIEPNLTKTQTQGGVSSLVSPRASTSVSPLVSSSGATENARKRRFQAESLLEELDEQHIVATTQVSTPRTDSAANREQVIGVSSSGALNRELFKEIANIKVRIDDIYRLVLNIQAEVSRIGVGHPNVDLELELPVTFQDLASLQQFERTVNKKDKKSYAKQLKSVGGNTGRKLVANMLQRLMTNGLQSGFNLAGKHEKKAFDKLFLYQVVLKAVKFTFKEETEKNVREYIGSHLKEAPYRLGGSKKPLPQEEGAAFDASGSDDE